VVVPTASGQQGTLPEMSELIPIADLVDDASDEAPIPDRQLVAIAGQKGPEIRLARPLDDFDVATLADVDREIKRLPKLPVSAAEHAALIAERKEIQATGGRPPAAQPVRDILIQKQYDVMRLAAPAVLRRLVRGAIDEADPLHERCLDIVAKRVAPIAFFEAMSKSEFKTEEEGGRAPSITINIGTTAAPPVTVDVVAVEKP
jgi:hypothetical protein